MYLFGDLTNLFFNHDISRQVFHTAEQNFSFFLNDFEFNDTNSVNLTTQEAIIMATITPNVVATETNISDLLIALVMADNQTVTPRTMNLVGNLSCLIVTYSNENIDGLSRPFDVIRELVTNPSYRLLVTTATCACVEEKFEEFNPEARCYSDETFFTGLGGVSGIYWMMYLFGGLSLTVFVLGFIQVCTIKMAGERQIYKLRLVSFRSVLRQDIGWYDVTDPGELSSILNE